ncbi:50S ribosomal protein L11 methyltransferase [Allofustis seminis]|uniref:50S ribosomal protein L11 methyltransferase n=1 Tax=Allofustis seminis TaxID=166939 RepID=UPI00036EC5F9|nr:50S ribosomal protein L11 methyltransferase [Allofustis seminis]
MALWKEYKIYVDSGDVDLVSQAFIALGSEGVSIEDPKDALPHPNIDEIWDIPLDKFPRKDALIKAYYPIQDDTNNVAEQLKCQIENLYENQLIQECYNFTSEVVNDEDWLFEWEKYYQPIHLSKSIQIIPSWEKDKGFEIQHCENIYLNPGVAFGTGDHPTTQLCAEAIEEYLDNSAIVYDVGTGSGILAIISAQLGAKSVYGFDYDAQAIHSAEQNAALNPLKIPIQFEQKDLLENVTKPADLIIANILEPIILRLIPMIPPLLNLDGVFIISGILNEQVPHIKRKLAEHQLIIKAIKNKGEWAAIIATHKNKEDKK